MATIDFEQVNKVFETGLCAVREFSLHVHDGEMLVLVGPSGCGKSTLLRMVAGLETESSGDIRIGEKSVSHLPPEKRDVAMVFQNYALYPHMTVRRNLAFPLQMMKVEKSKVRKRVEETADLLELGRYLESRPSQLSGGQRQRVAMGRALVREPDVFLMDEPLSNLDAKLRVQMRREITDLQKRLGTTTIYVTHDQVEAMTMGDRLAVIREGVLQQAGKPQDIYASPANVFVATFIGSPSMNLLWSKLSRDSQGRLGFDLGGTHVTIPEDAVEQREAFRSREGEEIIIGLRPESFVAADEVPESQRVEVSISHVEEMGHEFIAYFEIAAADLPEEIQTKLAAESFKPSPRKEAAPSKGKTTIVARLRPSLFLERGKTTTLGVKTGECHLFDGKGEAF